MLIRVLALISIYTLIRFFTLFCQGPFLTLNPHPLIIVLEADPMSLVRVTSPAYKKAVSQSQAEGIIRTLGSRRDSNNPLFMRVVASGAGNF